MLQNLVHVVTLLAPNKKRHFSFLDLPLVLTKFNNLMENLFVQNPCDTLIYPDSKIKL